MDSKVLFLINNAYDEFSLFIRVVLGQFCEIPMNHCELAPCEEGSACRTVNGTWQCLCKAGFLGRHCNLLPCDWLPCHANAICVNLEEENATRRSYRWVIRVISRRET